MHKLFFLPPLLPPEVLHQDLNANHESSNHTMVLVIMGLLVVLCFLRVHSYLYLVVKP